MANREDIVENGWLREVNGGWQGQAHDENSKDELERVCAKLTMVEENIFLDRSVYERMFIHETMVDTLLDILEGLSATFGSGQRKTFERRSQLAQLDTRIECLDRLAGEVCRQVESDDDVLQIRLRVERLAATMRTARELVEEGTNVERLVRRFKVIAPPVAGYFGELATAHLVDNRIGEEESERNRYGRLRRDSQEVLGADDIVDVIR